jgi:hypothetical protein
MGAPRTAAPVCPPAQAADPVDDQLHPEPVRVMKVVQNPNGFLVVTISENSDGSAHRLHVWDKPGGDSDIHQHRADFTSTIIEGEMTEEIYVYEDDPEGDWDRLQANCWSEPSGEYHVDVESRARCTVRIDRIETAGPGVIYDRNASELHRVIAVQLPLVTMVDFGPVYQQVHTIIRKRTEVEMSPGAFIS